MTSEREVRDMGFWAIEEQEQEKYELSDGVIEIVPDGDCVQCGSMGVLSAVEVEGRTVCLECLKTQDLRRIAYQEIDTVNKLKIQTKGLEQERKNLYEEIKRLRRKELSRIEVVALGSCVKCGSAYAKGMTGSDGYTVCLNCMKKKHLRKATSQMIDEVVQVNREMQALRNVNQLLKDRIESEQEPEIDGQISMFDE